MQRVLNSKECNLVQQIEAVFPLIESAISEAKHGIIVDGNVNQLLQIRSELNEMITYLNPKEYMPGFGHAIADSWDSDSILGGLLLDILCNYKKL